MPTGALMSAAVTPHANLLNVAGVNRAFNIRDIDLCGPTAALLAVHALHALSWAHACVRGAAGSCHKPPQRSISRISTIYVGVRKARALPSHAGVWQPHPAAPQKRTCAHHSAQIIRAWEIGHRSAEVAVLKCRLWHAYARCHRNKKNLRAILRSGSELV